jgi:hypothetical protein
VKAKSLVLSVTTQEGYSPSAADAIQQKHANPEFLTECNKPVWRRSSPTVFRLTCATRDPVAPDLASYCFLGGLLQTGLFNTELACAIAFRSLSMWSFASA